MQGRPELASKGNGLAVVNPIPATYVMLALAGSSKVSEHPTVPRRRRKVGSGKAGF